MLSWAHIGSFGALLVGGCSARALLSWIVSKVILIEVWYCLCSYTHTCKCTTRSRNYMYIKSGTGYGRLASTSALLLSALLYFRESPDRTWLYSLIIETLNQYCMNHCVFYSSHGDFGSNPMNPTPNCENAITKLLPNRYKAVGCHQTITKINSSTPALN